LVTVVARPFVRAARGGYYQDFFQDVPLPSGQDLTA
jgi:hypothetical protein